jgi:hypothetical protein
VHYIAVQCSAVQCSAVLCSAVQCSGQAHISSPPPGDSPQGSPVPPIRSKVGLHIPHCLFTMYKCSNSCHWPDSIRCFQPRNNWPVSENDCLAQLSIYLVHFGPSLSLLFAERPVACGPRSMLTAPTYLSDQLNALIDLNAVKQKLLNLMFVG